MVLFSFSTVLNTGLKSVGFLDATCSGRWLGLGGGGSHLCQARGGAGTTFPSSVPWELGIFVTTELSKSFIFLRIELQKAKLPTHPPPLMVSWLFTPNTLRNNVIHYCRSTSCYAEHQGVGFKKSTVVGLKCPTSPA